MDISEELQTPDEARPAKRARLAAPLAVTEQIQHEIADEDDDWDDVYSGGASSDKRPSEDGVDLTDASRTSEPTLAASHEPPTFQLSASIDQLVALPEETVAPQQDDGIPAEAVADNAELVAVEPAHQSTDQASEQIVQETSEVDQMPSTLPEHVADPTNQESERLSSQQPVLAPSNIEQPLAKVTDDPQFMAAAAAQKETQEAEWQFDSSDAESASEAHESGSDSDSDDSDSDSEGGYEFMDAATAAKLLMHGDGDDDDAEKSKMKTGGDHQPRTTNEKKDIVVPKPEVTVTPDMKITLLGTVEQVVESMVLITGATPGEYQVLESGSVLCDEGRQVLGAVAETFGRVQQPMYSIAFTNEKEIQEANLEFGKKVYYVDSHSTFVFTQPLRNLKGTDASNVHDEEVGEDELEFSDDEAEAEYKRQRKLAKKTGNGPLSRSAFEDGRAKRALHYDDQPSLSNHTDVPAQAYGGGLSYDDGEEPGEFYQPLKRPENLSALMAGGGPAPRPQQQSFNRGRGRSRGDFSRERGRGERGRGRGSYDGGRGRGASERGSHRGSHRGAHGGSHQQQQQQHRGNAHSFPDRHNGHADERKQHSLPPKPQAVPPTPTPSQYSDQGRHQQPAMQNYQFNGYNFQYGLQPQGAGHHQGDYSRQPLLQSSASPMPAGSYVAPAFYQQPGPQQQPQAVQPGHYAQQYNPQHYAQPNPAAAPYSGTGQQQHPLDLADIMRRLGVPPPQ